MNEEIINYEAEGWYLLNEEDDKQQAKEAFQQAIDEGNEGAYCGLASASENSEERVIYLRKAALAGRLDAMWMLQSETNDVSIEKMAWLKIAADNDYMPDAIDEFECYKLSEEQLKEVDIQRKKFLKQIEESGFKLSEGYL